MSDIQVTSINGMGAITDLGGGSFSTTGMEANDHMHISEDFIQDAGVVGSTDFAVAQASVPGKKVTVSGGVAYVLNSDYSALSLSEQKYWRVKMSGDTDVTITDNTSGNPRIDIICIKVDPTATPDDEATNVATLVAVEGTPAASPSVPATPDDYLKLAEVAVANGFTSILNADITDTRVLSTLQNGIQSVKAKAYINTTQDNLTDNAYTKVLLNTEVYDTGSNFDIANSRFVAPVTGYYQVNANVNYINPIANKRYGSVIYVNGASAKFSAVSIGSDTGVIYSPVSALLYVEAGQYIELYAWVFCGANTVDVYGSATIATATQMDIFLQSL